MFPIFRRRKKLENQEDVLTEQNIRALEKIQVPLLTLDPKWHQLFPEHLKTKTLIKKEKQLNKLIKKQGQTNNDLKEYEKAKKVIMQNVLKNMTDGQENDSPIRGKKQDANQKLLDELEEKIQDAVAIQDELPIQIRRANQDLLIESMRICYKTLLDNTKEIEKEEMWISAVRATMTEHILHKQEMEVRNTETYKYMYDLLGAEVLNLFDMDQRIWKGEEE